MVKVNIFDIFRVESYVGLVRGIVVYSDKTFAWNYLHIAIAMVIEESFFSIVLLHPPNWIQHNVQP